MDKNYFKDYYHLERNHWWFLARGEIIMSQLKQKIMLDESGKLNILNIGVATFRSSELLKNFGDVTSVEYDLECCSFITDVLNENVTNASITELPFVDGTFDLVCAFDVIEHVEDDQKAVEEMLRVCKGSGDIFLTVPAFQSLWSEHDIINHHYRRYSQNELLSLLQKKDVQIIKSSYFNFILFFPISLIRIIKRAFPRKQEAKSDFESFKGGFLNRNLYRVFSLESKLLRRVNFPFGVSLLLYFSKKAEC